MHKNIFIDTESKSNLTRIKVKGEIDIYTCTELRETLSNFLEKKEKDLILDLEETQYIDSTGLGTIAHTARLIEKMEGTIHILTTKPQIIKIFEVSGLLKKNINIYENYEKITEENSTIKG